MAIRLERKRATKDLTCAGSGFPIAKGETVVGLQLVGQRGATTAYYKPDALLRSLSVATARNATAFQPDSLSSLSGEDSSCTGSKAAAAAATTQRTTRRTRAAAAASKLPATVERQPRTCAVTGAVLQPDDLVLLLPVTAPKRHGTDEGGRVTAVALTAATAFLQPVLRAVDPAVAAALAVGMRGVEELPEPQRTLTQAALLEAVAIAAMDASADDDDDDDDGTVGGTREEESAEQGDGSGGDDSAAAVAAADSDGSALQEPLAPPQELEPDGRAAEAETRTGRKAAAAAKATGTGRPPLPPSRRSARSAKGAEAKQPPPPPPHADGTKAASLGSAAAAAAARPAAGLDDFDDIDRERAELMERNRRKLLELQLPGLVSELRAEHGAAAAAHRRPTASQRGVGSKRAREGSQEPPPPRRASLRQRGVAADSALAAGIDVETAAGVQLVAGRQAAEAAAKGAGAAAAAGEAEKSRHPQGELPFRSDNGTESSDAAFLRMLKAAAGVSAAPSAPTHGGDGDDTDAGGDDEDEEQERPTGHGSWRPGAAGARLAGLHLTERDVAKVTKDGVTHLAWLPGSERLLLAAADKAGKVSLWDVDAAEGSEAADTDGVLMFSPHGEYVSGLRWLGREAAVGPCRLITAAYDGSLRALDLGGGGTWLQLPAPGDPRDGVEFSALEVSPDGRTAYLGDPLGNLDVVDLRAPPRPRNASSSHVAVSGRRSSRRAEHAPQGHGAEDGEQQPRSGQVGEELAGAVAGKGPSTKALAVGPVGGLQLRDRKINSLHLEPSREHLLASSCSDGSVAVWDVRQLETAAAAAGAGAAGQEGGQQRRQHKGGSGHGSGRRGVKPLSEVRHGKSCHAAYWAADGSMRLLSTSYDDTLRVWADPTCTAASACTAAGGSRMQQLLSIPHNNQTGRWITPFRAVWSSACDAIVVGNMRRGLDVFSAPPPAAASSSPGEEAEEQGELQLQRSHRKKHGLGTAAAAPLSGAPDGGSQGQLLRTLTSEYLTAIPSRAACHPSLPVVVAATSSGRCHVWR